MSARAICNDCLADVERPERDSNGVMRCPLCSGEVCDCPSCMSLLNELHAGCRDPEFLLLSTLPAGFVWTPERGIDT